MPTRTNNTFAEQMAQLMGTLGQMKLAADVDLPLVIQLETKIIEAMQAPQRKMQEAGLMPAGGAAGGAPPMGAPMGGPPPMGAPMMDPSMMGGPPGMAPPPSGGPLPGLPGLPASPPPPVPGPELAGLM